MFQLRQEKISLAKSAAEAAAKAADSKGRLACNGGTWCVASCGQTCQRRLAEKTKQKLLNKKKRKRKAIGLSCDTLGAGR